MISILFDLDGTLVDSSQGIFNAFRYSFKKMGLEELHHQDMLPFIGPPLEVTFANYFQSEEEISEAIKHFRAFYNEEGVHQVSVYEGIRETLQRLIDKGCQLHVTTSKHEPMAKLMLKEQDLAQFFSGIYGSVENRYHKEDVIKACLTEHQLTLESTAIVGDTKFDMIGAINTGIVPVGVTWGFGSVEELITHGAKIICNSPSDLVEKY